uniref:Uncharacterized protein n=1 Tax=Helianthus annuus TaxID=4232 RepID=A0A251TNZ7_HELAN
MNLENSKSEKIPECRADKPVVTRVWKERFKGNDGDFLDGDQAYFEEPNTTF